MKKCRVQFLNVYTQEILRDEFINVEIADSMIESMVNPNPVIANDQTFLMDSQMRIYQGKYISHKELIEDGEKIYRVLFQVKSLNKQIPIKK